MKRKVGIMGTPVSSGNRGVSALGVSLANLCSAFEPVEIVLLVGNDNNQAVSFLINGKNMPIRVVNCRLSPRSRPCDHLAWIVIASFFYWAIPMKVFRRFLCKVIPWIAVLEEVDFVGDVRGGDSFSDIYGMQRFFSGFLMALTVLLIKKRLVQFPQTFGPFRSRASRLMAQYLLKRSSVVIARDEKSRIVAQELIGTIKEVILSPDVAFALESIPLEHIETEPLLNGRVQTGVIGLNVNGLMYNGGYTRNNMFGLELDYRNFLPELVAKILIEHPGEIWLIPHTYGSQDSVESDPEACRKVRLSLSKYFQRRVRIVTGEYDHHEIKWVIGQCEFFIGSRMHACIAALSQGVPCVGVAYSMKFEGVFNSVGMNGWVVDARKVSNPQAISKILKLYRKRNLVGTKLNFNTEEAKAKLKNLFQNLIFTPNCKEKII